MRAGGHDEVLEMLQHLWVDAYADACARVAVIEDYLGTRIAGTESPYARDAAISAAHKLAGTLGTFGLPTGSELGRSIERTLEAGRRAFGIGDGTAVSNNRPRPLCNCGRTLGSTHDGIGPGQ